MRIIADTHTHTVSSGHAFSTLRENTQAASNAGLRFIANTEHTNLLPGAPSNLFFINKASFPKELDGVHILFGCEVNIAGFDGSLDLPDKILDNLEWVIASFHRPVTAPGTVEQHTEAWLAVAQNPLVDVIGHCGNGDYLFDYDPVIEAFARHGKIVEINTHSFNIRVGSKENCTEIARLCKKHGVPVVVNSDAHSELMIGNVGAGIEMLESIDFPEELVLNADMKRFAAVAAQKSGRSFL